MLQSLDDRGLLKLRSLAIRNFSPPKRDSQKRGIRESSGDSRESPDSRESANRLGRIGPSKLSVSCKTLPQPETSMLYVLCSSVCGIRAYKRVLQACPLANPLNTSPSPLTEFAESIFPTGDRHYQTRGFGVAFPEQCKRMRLFTYIWGHLTCGSSFTYGGGTISNCKKDQIQSPDWGSRKKKRQNRKTKRNRYHLSFWCFFPCFIAIFGPIWGQSM